jgi:hypothetical protein
VHVLVRDQLVELAFGEHGVGDVEARVLPNVRQVRVQRVQQPVVRRTPHLRVDGVGQILRHRSMRVVRVRCALPEGWSGKRQASNSDLFDAIRTIGVWHGATANGS